MTATLAVIAQINIVFTAAGRDDDDVEYEYSDCSKLRFEEWRVVLPLLFVFVLEDLFPLFPLLLEGSPAPGDGASRPVLPRAEGRREGIDDDDGARVPEEGIDGTL